MESSTWARIDRGSTVFVISRMRSASVDFPWSMWAMIEKLRMCAWSAMDARLRIGAGAGAGSERRGGGREGGGGGGAGGGGGGGRRGGRPRRPAPPPGAPGFFYAVERAVGA